jgi:hypothetical protein
LNHKTNPEQNSPKNHQNFDKGSHYQRKTYLSKTLLESPQMAKPVRTGFAWAVRKNSTHRKNSTFTSIDLPIQLRLRG